MLLGCVARCVYSLLLEWRPSSWGPLSCDRWGGSRILCFSVPFIDCRVPCGLVDLSAPILFWLRWGCCCDLSCNNGGHGWHFSQAVTVSAIVILDCEVECYISRYDHAKKINILAKNYPISLRIFCRKLHHISICHFFFLQETAPYESCMVEFSWLQACSWAFYLWMHERCTMDSESCAFFIILFYMIMYSVAVAFLISSIKWSLPIRVYQRT